MRTVYIAIIRRGSLRRGALPRQCLPVKTRSRRFGKRKEQAAQIKNDLERGDPTKGNTSFAKMLDECAEMLNRELERNVGSRRIVVRHRLASFPLLSSLQEPM